MFVCVLVRVAVLCFARVASRRAALQQRVVLCRVVGVLLIGVVVCRLLVCVVVVVACVPRRAVSLLRLIVGALSTADSLYVMCVMCV